MTPDTDRGYFVKLDAPSPSARTPVARELAPPVPTHRKHRRRRVRPMSVALVVLVLGLGFLQTRPGGVSGQINDWIDKTRGVVDGATANPELHRAEDFFNEKFAELKAYPNMSEADLREDRDAGFGMGVSVVWCSPGAIVLQSLTAKGTVSRLLMNGETVGDVIAKTNCPADLSDPTPWKVEAAN